MKPLKTIITVVLLLFTVSAFAQTKKETLQWLRSHLNNVVVHYEDSILLYTMTKTYTFYDDAFVLKTEKNFYKDSSLNGAPAFSKIRYKDIFTENDSIIPRDIQTEMPKANVHVYTLWAERVYTIIGREDAPLSYWRTFNEPMGLDLYLPDSKDFSIEAIHKLYHLASLKGAKEKPLELNSEEDSLED
jgi:hypothetical protein